MMFCGGTGSREEPLHCVFAFLETTEGREIHNKACNQTERKESNETQENKASFKQTSFLLQPGFWLSVLLSVRQ